MVINIPKHVHVLSKVYWEIVDGLTKNNFPLEDAENITTMFFKCFKPLPRDSVKEKIE